MSNLRILIKEPFIHQLNRLFEIKKSNIMDFFRFPVHESNSEKAKLLWLIKLRWLAVCLFFFLTVPAITYGFLSRSQISSYIGLIGILMVFNFLTQSYLNDKKIQPAPTTICFHLAFDLERVTK
jgi:hypothetical protein